MNVIGVCFGNPAERVQGTIIGAGIAFHAPLHQAGNGAFAAADRAVQKQDSLFNAVPLGGGFEGVHERFERAVEPEHGVATFVVRVVKEFIVDPLLPARFLVHVRAA